MRSCVSIQDAERMAASTALKERQSIQLIATKIDEGVYNNDYKQLAKEVRLAASSSIHVAAGTFSNTGVSMIQSVSFIIIFVMGYLLGLLSPRIVRFFRFKNLKLNSRENK